jgi:hypothetical protein
MLEGRKVFKLSLPAGGVEVAAVAVNRDRVKHWMRLDSMPGVGIALLPIWTRFMGEMEVEGGN